MGLRFPDKELGFELGLIADRRQCTVDFVDDFEVAPAATPLETAAQCAFDSRDLRSRIRAVSMIHDSDPIKHGAGA
jgi:hypothetical protein